jgi:hypothetical protein
MAPQTAPERMSRRRSARSARRHIERQRLRSLSRHPSADGSPALAGLPASRTAPSVTHPALAPARRSAGPSAGHGGRAGRCSGPAPCCPRWKRSCSRTGGVGRRDIAPEPPGPSPGTVHRRAERVPSSSTTIERIEHVRMVVEDLADGWCSSPRSDSSCKRGAGRP